MRVEEVSAEEKSYSKSQLKKKQKTHENDNKEQLVNLFPRRKKSENHSSHDHMILSFEQLKPLFSLPLKQAAAKLGICTTAFKSVCRKLGLNRWPSKLLKQASSNH